MDSKFQPIFKEPNYQKYVNNTPDIHSKISKIISGNESGVLAGDIATFLDVEQRYLEITLYVWSRFWCTFFRHGRVFQDPNSEKWYYILNTHPLAREHNIYEKFQTIDKTKLIRDELEIDEFKNKIECLENDKNILIAENLALQRKLKLLSDDN